MGFFSKIFGKKEEGKVAGMENYMTLIRVYFQFGCLACPSCLQDNAPCSNG